MRNLITDTLDFDAQTRRRYPFRLIAAVLIVTAVGFAPDIAKRGGYSDDLSYSYSTHRLGPVQSGLDVFRHHMVRPVQTVVLQTLYALFYRRWGCIHATMVFFHLAGVALTGMLLWRWTRNRAAVFSGALLLATHPAANDSVFWPICAGHSLTVALTAAALLMTDRWATEGGRGSLIAAALLYVGACGCVEQAYVVGPLLAAAAWFAGAGGRRTLKALAVFGVSGLTYLGVQSIWLSGARVYRFETGGDWWPRVRHLVTWTATAFGPGEGVYDPARLLAAGWNRMTATPFGWALLIVTVAVAVSAALLSRASRGRSVPGPEFCRRTAFTAGMGLYLAIASMSVFLLREDAAVSHRHLRFPLLGLSITLAALVACIDERAADSALRRRLHPALLVGLLGVAATIANYGESADYVRSWRYQLGVVEQMRRCTPRGVPETAAVSAEGFQSHFGRVRTFADDWSLWGLAHVELPELFGNWNGPNLVLHGLESLDPERWPDTLAFVSRPEGVHLRNAVIEKMPDGATRETPLPLAEGSACPTEPLRLDRYRLRPKARFGASVWPVSVEVGVRDGESVFETRLVLVVGPDEGVVAFPLALDLSWTGPSGETRVATFPIESASEGRKLGVAAPWSIGSVPAGWTLRARIEDARGAPLMPLAQPPVEVDGPALVFPDFRTW